VLFAVKNASGKRFFSKIKDHVININSWERRKNMNVTRRGFLNTSGTVVVASGLAIRLKPIAAHTKPLKIKYARKTTTVYQYCSV
jgi:hypothetical protein